MLRFAALATALLISSSAHALLAGDIAFTAFNADEDGWSIVALSDFVPGTTVYFTENEPDASGNAFIGVEAFYTWNVGAGGVQAGTVVRFSAVQTDKRAATVGDFSARRSPALSQEGETLFAYLGTSDNAPTRFLAALTTESTTGIFLDPTGLSFGSTAVALPLGTDFGEYVGPRAGEDDFGAFGMLINTASNWRVEKTGKWEQSTPNLASFETTLPLFNTFSVPEPSTAMLFLAAIAGIGGSAARRRSVTNVSLQVPLGIANSPR